MPPVKPETLHNIIMSVTAHNLVEAGVRSAEFCIVHLFNTGSILFAGVKII